MPAMGGVRKERRQINRFLAHAHTSSTSLALKNLATGSAAEESFKCKFGENH